MKGAVALALAFGLSGCAGETTRTGWLDRPWIDSGCAAPGHCRVRGRLDMPRPETSTRGVLWLDDGRCLVVDLTGRFIRSAGEWDGRRVAVRGRAVAAAEAASPPCPSDLVLYADRLSLKAGR